MKKKKKKRRILRLMEVNGFGEGGGREKTFLVESMIVSSLIQGKQQKHKSTKIFDCFQSLVLYL